MKEYTCEVSAQFVESIVGRQKRADNTSTKVNLLKFK